MANRIQIRRDSENNWNDINPILADGELALTYDNNKIKIGNGTQNWSDLTYIVPTLSTVATSGDYNDLSGKPTVPSTLQELISYSAGNNKQFLRFNSGTSAIEFANDFRVVPYDDVEYPGGTLDVDKAGDVAFDQDGIYYCYQQPNAYSISYAGSTGWTPAGWLRINSIGPNNKIPQVGEKLTDGTTTSTITSIEAPWQDQGGGATFMLINISPAVSSWKNGSGSLTVYTGTEPHLNCWARLSNEIVTAPSTLTSDGVAGQMAYDSNYIYRCIQTNQWVRAAWGSRSVNQDLNTTSSVTFADISADSITVNGQTVELTGAVNPDYISMTTSSALNVAASGTDLTWDVDLGNSGITYSAGKFSLLAGKTYHIICEPAFQEYSSNGYILVELVDGTSNSRIGSQTLSLPYNSGFNEVNNPVYDLVYTPVTNQDVKFRVTGGSSGLTAQLRGAGFARMSIVQMNPIVSLGAVSTINATGNVTVGGILSSPQQTKASNATGTVGQICWDADYIYVCTATNTWKRSSLTGGY